MVVVLGRGAAQLRADRLMGPKRARTCEVIFIEPFTMLVPASHELRT